MDIFAVRLKELRKAKQMTQTMLAKEIQTTDDSIYSWERGRSQPSIENIRRLCIFFDVTSDYLLGLSEV